jgi:hypothetical protein
MSKQSRKSGSSPTLVAVASWLVPGGGYYLIGQRARAMTVFVSVIVLFLAGILIGGIRIMDPPGWSQYGYMTQLVLRPIERNRDGQELSDIPVRVEPASEEQEQDPRVDGDDHDQSDGAALFAQPFAELGDKPWFMGQILCGPITLVASTISIHEARPRTDANPPQEGIPISHSHSWEIGALYTAVAGMLNLLVIIDATYRAGRD